MERQSAVAGIGKWLWLVAVLGIAVPSSAQAQLGGLKKLKEKVEKVAGDKPAADQEAAPPERSPYNDQVLELTNDAAACLERALAAENAELESFRKWASGVRTQSDFEGCQGQLLMSPDGQKLSQEYMAAIEGKEGQAAMDAMNAFAMKMEAFVEQKCGPKPSTVDERKAEARKRAAEKAQAECGYTAQQYAILKERLVPVCGTGVLETADGALKLPGDGKNIFWVYSAAEVAVLKQKCATLGPALKSLL